MIDTPFCKYCFDIFAIQRIVSCIDIYIYYGR